MSVINSILLSLHRSGHKSIAFQFVVVVVVVMVEVVVMLISLHCQCFCCCHYRQAVFSVLKGEFLSVIKTQATTVPPTTSTNCAACSLADLGAGRPAGQPFHTCFK